MSKRTLCEMLPVLAAYVCYRNPAAAALLRAMHEARQHGCEIEKKIDLTELNLLTDGCPPSSIHEAVYCDRSTADRRIDSQLRALLIILSC